MQWLTVCGVEDLLENAGVCALVNGQQVALFLIPGGETEAKVYALSNYDPFGKANVLSRGIVGDLKDQPVVASPLYKQHFNLETGVCLEDESVILPVYACHIEQGAVQVSLLPSEQVTVDPGAVQTGMTERQNDNQHEGVA